MREDCVRRQHRCVLAAAAVQLLPGLCMQLRPAAVNAAWAADSNRGTWCSAAACLGLSLDPR